MSGIELIASLLLTAAVVVILLASIVAVRLTRIAGTPRGWFLVTAAFIVVVVGMLLGGMLPDPWAQFVRSLSAVITALLLLLGMLDIRDLLVSFKEAKEKAQKETALADEYLDSSGGVIAVIENDGTIRRINSAAAELLDAESANVLVGRDWFDVAIPAEDRPDARARYARIVETGTVHVDSDDCRLYTRSGEERFIACRKRPLLREGKVDGVLLTGIDITERRRIQGELEFRSIILDHTTDSFVVHDLEGRIIYANAVACAWRGVSREDILQMRMSDLGTSAAAAEVPARMETLVRVGNLVFETENPATKDSPSFPVEVNANIVDIGGLTFVLSTGRDITDRKQAERTIRHMAFHDSLTGLPNRALLGDRVKVALAHARRHEESLALIFLDVDNLKFVNDTFGHSSGDELLRMFGTRLECQVRSEDTVARVSGDEFVVLLSRSDRDAAEHVANKILEAFRTPLVVYGSEILAAGSMGVALFPEDGDDFDGLFAAADAAMYRAKETGKNRYCFYTSEMRAATTGRAAYESELRDAIKRGEFRLHYQPFVVVSTGEIVGFEALLRWQHPERGLLPPLDFLPIAEETGLIEPIGHWVLVEACKQRQRWAEEGFEHLRVSVNVSARQISDLGFVDTVRECVASEFDPTRLQLELTESAAMGNPEVVAEVLNAISELGVTFALDDFGIGYSALAYLTRLPVHTIKLDRTFVFNMSADSEAEMLAFGVLALAQSLQFKVVAEGVETAEQLALLKQWGCDEMQGYLISPPVPAEEATRLLLEQRERA